VAYDYAAAAEHVTHEHSGLLAPLGDTRALIAAAVSLAAEVPRARALGANARLAAQALQWDRLVAAMETVLMAALSAPLPPTRRRALRREPPSARGSAG
jgi:glycosyltransferase involved in cell wall biosynthesis